MPDPFKLTPALLFSGQAEEALNFYLKLFPDSALGFMQLYGPAFPGGPEGKVAFAQASLAGHDVVAMDSSVEQPFEFTPAISFFVEVPSEAEIDRLFGALSEGGEVLMPLERYPFAAKYAWVQDRFGVSWQLSLAQPEG